MIKKRVYTVHERNELIHYYSLAVMEGLFAGIINITLQKEGDSKTKISCNTIDAVGSNAPEREAKKYPRKKGHKLLKDKFVDYPTSKKPEKKIMKMSDYRR